MSSTFTPLLPKDLTDQIYTKQIQLPDAITVAVANPALFKNFARHSLLHDERFIIRLWSAWLLGELQDTQSTSLLVKAYRAETYPEARVDITWALFVINPAAVSLKLFKEMLDDELSSVPMLAIRYMRGASQLERKLSFIQTYHQLNNRPSAQIELLRNIRSFTYEPSRTCDFLMNELRDAPNLEKQTALIDAIGKLNTIRAANELYAYFLDNWSQFLGFDVLANQMAHTTLQLSRVKLYNLLDKLYEQHPNGVLRDKIIEIAAVGGTCCKQLLQRLYELETSDLRREHMDQKIAFLHVDHRAAMPGRSPHGIDQQYLDRAVDQDIACE
jgi:hypothetical protein